MTALRKGVDRCLKGIEQKRKKRERLMGRDNSVEIVKEEEGLGK